MSDSFTSGEWACLFQHQADKSQGQSCAILHVPGARQQQTISWRGLASSGCVHCRSPQATAGSGAAQGG